MPRYPSSNVTYAIGPGGISPAVKLLLIINVVLFFMNMIVGDAMVDGSIRRRIREALQFLRERSKLHALQS